MTSAPIVDGVKPVNRYRLPGIEREGIAQLSLLETALWPLQGGTLITPRFESSYTFMAPTGKQTAHVTVRSAMGLKAIDEFVLWGLLGMTLSRPDADSLLLATPYWILKQLGLDTGGSQYLELRDALRRLASTSYENTGFYNPDTQEREYVVFQFLSMLLPTVGGFGGTVDTDRLWRIEWNPAFFRFCRATSGNLLFDLDLYRELTPAARRLFLKLKDRFWRMKRVFMNVDDLTINGLGFSASRPLYKRKFDLMNCVQELLDHQIIELGWGQTDPQDLILKRGKGSYVVQFFEGPYFRKPAASRTMRQQNAIATDPLYEPLRNIGVDEAGIRRIFRDHARNAIQRWVRITDAAIHEKPKGFPGFKVSPAAFLLDGIQQNRLPPDWMHAHEKRREHQQWEAEHAVFQQPEQKHRRRFEQERAQALQAFLQSPEGRAQYDRIFTILLELYKRTDPDRYREAAHEAAVARVERDNFHFPEYAVWAVTTREEEGSGEAL